ncbi:MAG: glycosyltransferase family 2 protein [Polyangiales bacterium]
MTATPTNRPTVTLMVVTLNEVEGMKAIMPKVPTEWVDQIIVVDGGSTDGTIEYAKEHGYEVYVQKKRGIRHAYIEVYPQLRGDIVVTFSPDGNSIPELIAPLVQKMADGYDMVIVSRYAPGAKSVDDDIVTGFGNWLFTNVINLVHGGRYTDAMVIYRGWKRELFRDLDMLKDESYVTEKLFGTVMGCEPLLSIRAAKRKLKLADIPGDEPPRIGGVRKLQVIRWGAAYMAQVFLEKVYWR